ncbi:MAG: type II toxin-antitoxin system PemK/MazF family toxin [Chloroflexota bacterium]|nr:type II toxin-antitoxin system PemK/MazF family toxin [Chloroflexota bacterium]
MARGDIYFVNLPYQSGGGREQAGHRPVLAVQADIPGTSQLPTVMVVPMTTNQGALRFAHTFLVQPSAINGLTQPSVLLVFQLRAADRARLGKKVGTLEQGHLQRLEQELRRLLAL